ncbi:hypothetical protein L6164_025203 [Bauhinia variegata]|uniref:Uncharacterized protein n=1 Tax=Bauhinia variegata TaxID=167791 RepID=A0ACB9M2E8_BAUVA|nr:hypothetical protein L6164_025203 [Bauhinia variegata]
MHRETNPHFLPRPVRPPVEDDSHPPGQRHGQPSHGSKKVPVPVTDLDNRSQGQPPRHGQPQPGSKKVPVSITDPDDQSQGPPSPDRDRSQRRVTIQEFPSSRAAVPPPIHGPEHGRATTPTGKPPHPEHKRRRHGYRVPTPHKTKPLTWFAAVFCVIFWLVIIIGGLIVLIVYLVFRPQDPRFDVSYASLNVAYLDMGYLLNADLRLLANFTNPNKKVHVDFSSVIVDIYYGSTLIATQYVEPFSAAKTQSRFADIHLVTSQVRLPLVEIQRLMKQIESNGVLFEVKGVFRARSKFGSILRYSYNLYGHCSIMLTRPPDGVLIKRKCRTKR